MCKSFGLQDTGFLLDGSKEKSNKIDLLTSLIHESYYTVNMVEQSVKKTNKHSTLIWKFEDEQI